MAGKLLLGHTGLRLESGAPRWRLSAQSIRYADIAGVETAHRGTDRIHGRPTAVVRRRRGTPLAITSVDGPGSLRELVERLSRAVAGTTSA